MHAIDRGRERRSTLPPQQEYRPCICLRCLRERLNAAAEMHKSNALRRPASDRWQAQVPLRNGAPGRGADAPSSTRSAAAPPRARPPSQGSPAQVRESALECAGKGCEQPRPGARVASAHAFLHTREHAQRKSTTKRNRTE
eukprot:5852241-Pleurochrysis_carterae.AAC.1